MLIDDLLKKEKLHEQKEALLKTATSEFVKSWMEIHGTFPIVISSDQLINWFTIAIQDVVDLHNFFKLTYFIVDFLRKEGFVVVTNSQPTGCSLMVNKK